MPGIHAVNFLLHETLGGGGSSSLHADPLCKSYGQVLLSVRVPVPRSLVPRPPFSFDGSGVKFTVRGAVATVVLARPKRGNALSAAVVAALKEAVAQLQALEGTVRVVILAAEGKIFCAGGDAKDAARVAGLSAAEQEKEAREFAELLRDWALLPMATIARVQGAAMGGGLGLVSVCDAAVALSSAELALSEVRLGMVPATISPYVFAKLGAGRARKAFVFGERLSAEDARQAGLLHAVVNDEAALDAEVDALCEAVRAGALWSNTLPVFSQGASLNCLERRDNNRSAVPWRPIRQRRQTLETANTYEGLRPSPASRR